jgi:hypothetical protein
VAVRYVFHSTEQRPKAIRHTGAFRIAAIFAITFASKQAGAVKVHVAAGTRIEARADRGPVPNSVVVRGTLRDDVGSPIADSHVAIAFFEPHEDGAAITLPWPRQCPGAMRAAGDAHEPHVAPDEYVVDTDALGTFCFETSLPIDRAQMKLRFAGNRLYDATAAEVAVDLTHTPIVVTFDPEPTTISLDRPSYSVGLRIIAPGLPKIGWRVKLSDEKGRALGSADVDPDGLSRIDVPTADLEGPGLGELHANLEGAPLGVPEVVRSVERHARVELAIEDQEPGGVPEDGIVVAVRARSSRGPASGGSVEAKLGDRTVGAAPVREGKANVAMTFGTMRATSVNAWIRYLPEAPWWEPPAPLQVKLAVRPPSAWRRAPLVALALAVAAWMLRESYVQRFRRSPPKPHAPAKPVDAHAMQVLKARNADEGWTGRVFDAHDRFPLVAARISILVKGFPGRAAAGEPAAGSPDDERDVRARTVTDDAGQFVLAPEARTERAVLRVESPLHATLEQPLPAPSVLSIGLVARRRKLLDRLVQWAIAEWGAWDATRDPTPHQVAGRAARRAARGSANAERAAAAEAWARAVESTAFGPAPVDEQAERKVTSLEPPK